MERSGARSRHAYYARDYGTKKRNAINGAEYMFYSQGFSVACVAVELAPLCWPAKRGMCYMSHPGPGFGLISLYLFLAHGEMYCFIGDNFPGFTCHQVREA
jgi:hypothetical protein